MHKVYDPHIDQLSSKVLATQYLITRMFINYWWAQGFRNLDCNHTKLTSDKKDVTVVGTFDAELVMYDLKPGGDYNSHEQLMRLVFPFYFIGLVCFTTQAVVQDKKSGAKNLLDEKGLYMLTYWVSWFLASFSIGSLTTLLFSLVYCLDFDDPGGVTLTRPLVVIGFMMLYTANSITFSFMIACFIKKSLPTKGFPCLGIPAR
ncbi:phospholipid-transporting ATPase ABCA3-like [Biomphalaria glabrata]|uniref:Phospholipid-transporting ATPase ABCA3-like n=1 Tax=Biomphalaria glabrata TaxID=6526 RepID=A0A9W3BGP4_BIOGL|nr:phospholipid-transporting ATPase ABCA3-like [Biomphalaria glabrata]